ncbi:hypothetical protein BJ508DRAFT_418354 [Ascobolus immersus RN42]|uniref:Uncharacterized protein n=1 Tax=Ascobolus immersus RN42 TaxID=1160509 RepID=A0A3N4HMC4_ASCIM|nr:hypothetical protein BJ508DRAFT_418354 [Ascobolus immersus RN42]
MAAASTSASARIPHLTPVNHPICVCQRFTDTSGYSHRQTSPSHPQPKQPQLAPHHHLRSQPPSPRHPPMYYPISPSYLHTSHYGYPSSNLPSRLKYWFLGECGLGLDHVPGVNWD